VFLNSFFFFFNLEINDRKKMEVVTMKIELTLSKNIAKKDSEIAEQILKALTGLATRKNPDFLIHRLEIVEPSKTN
jgi:hypothetical protein